MLDVYRAGLGAPGKERDAVCGMRVGEDAPGATVEGRTYRFCSEGCRRRFRRDPERYLEEGIVTSGA